MKSFIIVVLALVALAAASPAKPPVHVDIYKNLMIPPSARIVGGADAAKNQFPYQASIKWGASSTAASSHICGGTLIDKDWVLTAGHCKAYTTGVYTVVLGQLKQNEEHNEIQKFEIQPKDFIVHDKYPGGGVVAPDDIALIKLPKSAEITGAAVKPAELPAEADCNDYSAKADLSGWGRTSSWSGLPEHLQFIELPRITNDQCAKDITAILGYPGPLTDTMTCTTANKDKKESACNGDSGGPLVIKTTNKIVGVVSWGINPCGTTGAPSVFTRVCSHLDFINGNIDPPTS